MANLYFYTVLLALFPQQARELDFGRDNFRASVGWVQRVHQVYSPALVQFLEGVLEDWEGGNRKGGPWRTVAE